MPATASTARLVFKRGPDCGIMSITSAAATLRVDTYGDAVEWCAAQSAGRGLGCRLSESVLVGDRDATVDLPSSAADAATEFTVEVTGDSNKLSSHDYVQIVGLAVFHQ